MITSTDRRDRFEVVYDPAEGTAFVYRSIWAGVCGPMTTRVPVEDREGAEVEALRYGLLRCGEWTQAGNGTEYAEAEKVADSA